MDVVAGGSTALGRETTEKKINKYAEIKVGIGRRQFINKQTVNCLHNLVVPRLT